MRSSGSGSSLTRLDGRGVGVELSLDGGARGLGGGAAAGGVDTRKPASGERGKMGS